MSAFKFYFYKFLNKYYIYIQYILYYDSIIYYLKLYLFNRNNREE